MRVCTCERMCMCVGGYMLMYEPRTLQFAICSVGKFLHKQLNQILGIYPQFSSHSYTLSRVTD